MNDKIKQIAFLQALGIACYIAIFATTVYALQTWSVARDMEPHPALGIALFLLTFIFSALICGSVMFAYPIRDCLKSCFRNEISKFRAKNPKKNEGVFEKYDEF